MASSFLALVHCGGDPPPDADPDADAGPDAPRPRPDASAAPDADGRPSSRTEGPGSRFEPLYNVRNFEDGTEDVQFADLFQDTKLRIFCRIREAGSSEHRCMPFLEEGFEGFADSSCSQPAVVLTGTPSGITPFANLANLEPCAPRIVRLNALRSGQAYRRDEHGQCRPLSRDSHYTTLPTAVPLSTFGAFTRTADTVVMPRERGGTKLALERWRFDGEDGSFQLAPPRIVDVLRSAEGTVHRTMDRALRFFPSSARVRLTSHMFAEPTCTTPVLQSRPNDPWACHADARRTNIASRAEPIEPGCVGWRAVREPAGDPLQLVHRQEQATCGEAEPVFFGERLYASQPLDEIPQDTLVPVARTFVTTTKHTVPGSKLDARSVLVTSADGLELEERGSGLFLSKYDVPCTDDYHSRSTTERCVPDVPRNQDYGIFSDAACTQALIALLNDDACAPAKLYRSGDGSSSDLFERPTGAPVTADTFYRSGGNGECTPFTAQHDTYVYLARGTPVEVPLAELPRLFGRRLAKASEL
ncbi:MAG: hypothetical protein KF894_21610 [Labilithrix sp.]|nr:hypothetical protein [Labilithrix sp.]